jgi:DnaJ-domain-containing protein 1
VSDISERLEAISRAHKTAEAALARQEVIIENAQDAVRDALAALQEKYDVDSLEAAERLSEKMQTQIETAIVKVEEALKND